MDSPEPDTPFAAVTAQTTKYGRVRLPPGAFAFCALLDPRTRDALDSVGQVDSN